METPKSSPSEILLGHWNPQNIANYNISVVGANVLMSIEYKPNIKITLLIKGTLVDKRVEIVNTVCNASVKIGNGHKRICSIYLGQANSLSKLVGSLCLARDDILYKVC